MPRVDRTEQAQHDLEGILDYLDTQSDEAAERFAIRFDQSCGLHATYPQIGARADEYAPGLRYFTVWNYAVFYRPFHDGIQVIRTIHGARDIPTLFQ